MSKGPRLHPPRPDVILKATFEGHSKNLGDCRDIGYREMWERYRLIYNNSHTEHELRLRHEHWKRIVAGVQ